MATERHLALAALAALWLLGATPVRAANAPAPGDNRPIAVTAQHGIEWQKAAQVYVARGNAVATRGNTTVRADTLTAHYRPAKGGEAKVAEGGNEVYRLDADGRVVITNGADTVIGDQAIYDVAQEIALITGKHLKMTTPSDVVTARDSFEWYDQQQLAVARGDAVATRGDRRMRADVLTAHLTKETPAEAGKPATAAAKPAAGESGPAAPAQPASSAELENSRISRVDAQGNVVITTPTDIARGDYGVYDAKTDIATLVGHVTITREQNVIRGPYAVVDLKTNVSRMMTLAGTPGKPAPQVEGLFVRQDTGATGPGAKATGASVAGKSATGKSSPTGTSRP